MTTATARRAADLLWNRWRGGSPGGHLPPDVRPTSMSDAWAIQQALTELAGPRIGWKIAASSVAGQQHISVPGPIAGPLVARGLRSTGESLPLTSMASAEPEIAFRLGADLPASGRPYDRRAVLAAVDAVLPAIEVPDSRFADVPAAGESQLVADLACAAFVVLGDPITRPRFDGLKDRRVVLHINGAVASEGAGAHALGDPCEALTWLVNTVTEFGSDLVAGEIVITGAAAPPRAICTDDVLAGEIDGVGSVTVSIA